MEKKKFKVVVDEIIQNYYIFTIEAENAEEAENLALEQDFWNADEHSETGPCYEVIEVEEMED